MLSFVGRSKRKPVSRWWSIICISQIGKVSRRKFPIWELRTSGYPNRIGKLWDHRECGTSHCDWVDKEANSCIITSSFVIIAGSAFGDLLVWKVSYCDSEAWSTNLFRVGDSAALWLNWNDGAIAVFDVRVTHLWVRVNILSRMKNFTMTDLLSRYQSGV